MRLRRRKPPSFGLALCPQCVFPLPHHHHACTRPDGAITLPVPDDKVERIDAALRSFKPWA